jgi:Uma2 family endonuclease
MHPIIDLTDDQFFSFCKINRDLRIERTATGELLIMPPTGSETGGSNSLNSVLTRFCSALIPVNIQSG